GDDQEDESQNRDRLLHVSGVALCFDDPAERPVPGHERWNDDDPAQRDREQRDTGTDSDTRGVPQLAVDLVVPDEVVDPERHQRPQEDQERVPDLYRRASYLNLLSHDRPPAIETAPEE